MSATAATVLGEGSGELATSMAARYRRVRDFSRYLCETLEPEDMVVQTMADMSPTKWHLAHTTWFFETFVLKQHLPDYAPFQSGFEYLFNSYYNSVGKQFPRPHRGDISRPTVQEMWAYREYVDEHLGRFLANASAEKLDEVSGLMEIGCQHEQQHQELVLTDIKHMLAQNPLHPVYRETPAPDGDAPVFGYVSFDGGLLEIGHRGEGFAFDNEYPRHKEYLEPYRLANRLTTCGEYIAFMEDGGYDNPLLWLSMGWATVQEEGWKAPMYWTKRDGQWHQFTLSGLRPVHPDEPVCHVSYFEADAFARWAGARLPREAEWEAAAEGQAYEGNFVERGNFHPVTAAGGDGLLQLFGDVWEWTASPYIAYPGYYAAEGAIGEYNGKFMCDQWVLRGGSCATSDTHIRHTYRNFFPASARWQFSGIRLAKDAS